MSSLIVRCVFFFSSRRRHTRLQGDWSSDVCSPDLGVFNLVTGTGQVAEMLAAHPGVDIVAVAGPTSAGRRIAAICGETLKPVSLELGGESAAVMLDDGDPGATAARHRRLCLFHARPAGVTMFPGPAPPRRPYEAAFGPG